jgi:hypothetical protein
LLAAGRSGFPVSPYWPTGHRAQLRRLQLLTRDPLHGEVEPCSVPRSRPFCSPMRAVRRMCPPLQAALVDRCAQATETPHARSRTEGSRRPLRPAHRPRQRLPGLAPHQHRRACARVGLPRRPHWPRWPAAPAQDPLVGHAERMRKPRSPAMPTSASLPARVDLPRRLRRPRRSAALV